MKKLNLPDWSPTDANSFSYAVTPLEFINGNEDFRDLDGWSRLLYVAMLDRAKLFADNSDARRGITQTKQQKQMRKTKMTKRLICLLCL